jgi:hypothetical protein
MPEEDYKGTKEFAKYLNQYKLYFHPVPVVTDTTWGCGGWKNNGIRCTGYDSDLGRVFYVKRTCSLSIVSFRAFRAVVLILQKYNKGGIAAVV